MANLSIILLGAALQLWPAILNGYPLVFSDTGGFLEQALMPDMGWDKPWIYGPFLTPFHLGQTLWPAIIVQASLLSAMLWVTQVAQGWHSKRVHSLLCVTLSATTAAPWFASLLMPDLFAPIAVLGLYALAYAPDRFGKAPQAWITVVTAIAIAVHLAHLVLAAVCIALLCLVLRRIVWRAAVPLAAALALLLTSNLIGHGRLAISPYGAVFALARLVGDGPARIYLDRVCPEGGYRLCAWKGRLPTDSDAFLWDPHGPVWAEGYGPIRIAPEAAALVRATLAAEPARVLAAAIRNTVHQLVRVQVGDALVPDHLEVTVAERLQAYFPPSETDRFRASRQAAGTLLSIVAPLAPIYTSLLVVGALGTIAIAVGAWRTNQPLKNLAKLVLVALLANAFATGALSGPHDRYQARIAWLVVVPPVFAILRRWRHASVGYRTELRLPGSPPPPAAIDGSCER